MGAALPIIGIASSLIGTGVSALGSLEQGQAQSAAAHYQSVVSANNAKIAAQSAEYASAAGGANVEAAGLKARAQMADAVAALAAGNIDVNQGSAVDIKSTATEMGRLSELETANQTAAAIYGYQVQESGFQAESILQQQEAQQAQTAGYIGAAGSLLSGAGNVASRWSIWQQVNGGVGNPAFGDALFEQSTGYNPNTVFFPGVAR